MTKKIGKINPTVIDLVIGILIYGIFLEIIGMIFVENRVSYTLGLLLGLFAAVLLVIHMYTTLDRALDMDSKSASSYIQKRSFLRALVMLATVALGMIFQQISFFAIVIGILGLKISAFLQPFTNLYITTKILKERR